MSKPKSQPTAPVAPETETTMTDTTLSTKVAEKNLFIVRDEYKLTAFHCTDGVWDPMTDLYVKDLVASQKVLDAVAAYLAGSISGSEKLMFVAPTVKLAYENGTGTMAYVRFDYRPGLDAVKVETPSGEMLADVDPRDIPAEGYRRLHLIQGKLVAYAWEEPITARGSDKTNGDNSFFFRLWAQSCLLAGHTVSVSVGPQLKERAQQIMDVYNSDDPAAANDARRQANRAAARVNREFKNGLENAESMLATAGPSAYEVPLYAGGKISLSDWPYREPIFRRNQAGILMTALYLDRFGPDNLATRLAAATAINSEAGVCVEL